MSKIKTLAKKVIAKFIKTKTIRFEGLRLKGAFEDYGILRAIASQNHEQFFTKLFLESIEPEAVVIDIGAHLGKYSLLAGKRLGSQGKVVCFEPHPRTFSYLSENITSNNLRQVVVPYNFAISSEEGVAHLHADQLQSDFTSMAAIRDVKDVVTVPIKTKQLDRVIFETSPDIFKIDVEGAECEVLQGIEATIVSSRKNHKKPVVFIEANANALAAFKQTPETLYNKLKALGFQKISKICEQDRQLKPILDLRAVDCENWLCQ